MDLNLIAPASLAALSIWALLSARRAGLSPRPAAALAACAAWLAAGSLPALLPERWSLVLRVALGAAVAIAWLLANDDFARVSSACWPKSFRKEAHNAFSARVQGSRAVPVIAGLLGVCGLAVALARASVFPEGLPAVSVLSALAPAFPGLLPALALGFTLWREVRFAQAESQRSLGLGQAFRSRESRTSSLLASLLALPWFASSASSASPALAAAAGPTGRQGALAALVLAGVCLVWFARRKQRAAAKVRASLRRRGFEPALPVQLLYELSQLDQAALGRIASDKEMFGEATQPAFALLDDWRAVDLSRYVYGFEERYGKLLAGFQSIDFLEERHATAENRHLKSALRGRIEQLLVARVPTLETDAERLAMAERYPDCTQAVFAALATLADPAPLLGQLRSWMTSPETRDRVGSFLRSHPAPQPFFLTLGLRDALGLYDHRLLEENLKLLEARFASMGIEATIVSREEESSSSFDPDSASYDYAAYNVPEPSTFTVHEKRFEDRLFAKNLDWTEESQRMLEVRWKAQGPNDQDWTGKTLARKAADEKNARVLQFLMQKQAA